MGSAVGGGGGRGAVDQEGRQATAVVVLQVESIPVPILVGSSQFDPRVLTDPALLHLDGAEPPRGYAAAWFHQRGLEEICEEVEVGIDPQLAFTEGHETAI